MAAILIQTERHRLGHGVTGVSGGAWGSANLGDHVGDDPVAVSANRAALAESVAGGLLVFMNQVHGNTVAVVGESGVVDGSADALVTVVPGLALAVLTADCVPILLHDDEVGVAGAVHAGRNGVRLEVIGATVQAMRELGATSIAAQVGPHIGGCCYEVSAEVQAELTASLPMTRATTTWGTPALDLAAGVGQQLRAAGVGRVTVDGRCTMEDGDLFSYRRDPVTGRMAGVVVLAP